MVENGAATKPSAEQIDEWVKTFPGYDTAQMRNIVRTERFRLKPEGGWDKTAERNIVRTERFRLKPEGGWDKTAEQLKTAEQPRHTNDAHRAVHLW